MWEYKEGDEDEQFQGQASVTSTVIIQLVDTKEHPKLPLQKGLIWSQAHMVKSGSYSNCSCINY